jgi:hypothetical protein
VTLTIETGAVVAGANSYASVEDTRAFAVARGLALPATDAAIECLLVQAMDYLEGLRGEYQGSKTDKSNPLQWPRTGVVIDGFIVEDDELPACLAQAQMRLACYAHVNGGLSATSDGRVVIEETVVGAVTTRYADHGDSSPQPSFPEADVLIAPLLLSSAFGGAGVAVRV